MINGLISKVEVQGTINESRDIDSGWTVDTAIPWSRFGVPSSGDSFLIQFARTQWDYTLNEDGKYQRGNNSWVSAWASMEVCVWGGQHETTFKLLIVSI